MLSNTEITKLCMADKGVQEWVAGLTDKVYANAVSTAQQHVSGNDLTNPNGKPRRSYLSGLSRRVVKGRQGRPVGIVTASAPHSLLVEYGTAERATTTGANRGAMPALHVLSGALAAAGMPIGQGKDENEDT